MIQLYECPNCGKDTVAVTNVADLSMPYRELRCPACAPTPGKTPHDYKPAGCDPQLATKYATGGVVKLTDQQARSILSHACVVPTYVHNDVCCLDPGDCNGPCGLG